MKSKTNLLIQLFMLMTIFCLFGYVDAQTSFNISNQTTGDTLFTMDNDGNVGIGTTTPTVDLELRGSIPDDASRLYLTNSDETHTLFFYSGRENVPNPLISWTATDALRFATWETSLTEIMRLTNSGNLGLGTSDPTSRLDIQMFGNGIWQRAIRVLNPDMVATDALFLVLGRSDDFKNMGHMNFKYAGDASDDNYLSFGLYGVNDVLNIMGSGNVGIGTTAPSELLEVAGTIHSTTGGFRFPDGTLQSTASTATGNHNTLDQAYDEGGAGAGRIITADNGPVHIGGSDGLVVNNRIGIATTTPDYPLEIYPGTNNRGINIDHNQSGTGTTRSIYVDIDKTSVGTSDIYGTEILATNNNGSGNTFGLMTDVGGTSTGLKYGVRGVAHGDGWKYGLYGFATGTDTKFGVFGTATGSGTNWAGYFGSGNVHISNRLALGTQTPNAGIHLVGSGYPGSFMYLEAPTGSDAGFRLYEDAIAKWHIFNNATEGGLQIYNTSNTNTVFFAEQSTGNVGIGTTNPSSLLTVAGTVECDVLEINGGSDIAEPFDINHSNNIEAGMVMTIDAMNPGKLKVAQKANDRCVAGIISGAGGINPGMIMGQSGTIADGEYPVALTGRVYCWADASTNSIQPGDLLTTSDLPGHAMKVNDYTKAQGAVVGKAMSALEDGQGLILVLVSLQ